MEFGAHCMNMYILYMVQKSTVLYIDRKWRLAGTLGGLHTFKVFQLNGNDRLNMVSMTILVLRKPQFHSQSK